jgi:type I restriction enzyme S subunit
MLERYASYKSSGVEWLGEVPEHWDVRHLKSLAEIKGGKDSSDVEIDAGGFPIYGSGGIFGRASKFLYKKPSVLLGRKGTVDKPLFVKEPFWSVDTMFYTDIKHDVEPKYFYYKCLTIQFGMYQYGSAVPSMAQNVLSRILFAVPLKKEQKYIADYLDRKTSQIDQEIKLLTQKSEQYSKLKQSLINETVTQGLDKTATMKSSGIDWVGDIPEHWTIKRLRDIATIKTGGKDTVDNVDSGKYPFFVRSQTIERINSYSFNGEAILTAGDGVGVGKVFHYVNEKFDYHQRVYRISNFKTILGKFAFYYMRNNFYKDALRLNAKSTVDSLRMPMFLNFPMVFGDIREQSKIIKFLDRKTQKIDKIIKTINKKISKLKELRKTLINDVVTGKIKVA